MASTTAREMITICTIVTKCSIDMIASLFSDEFSRSTLTPRNPITKFLDDVYVSDPVDIDEGSSMQNSARLCATAGREELFHLI